MIKILFLIPHLENKGPVVQLLNLLKGLDNTKFSSTILTIIKERENSLEKKFSDLNVNIVKIERPYFQVPIVLRELRKKIISIKPDLIHSNSVITDILFSFSNVNIPCIFTMHNFIYDDLYMQYPRYIANILTYYEEKAIMKADIVVTCSNTLYEKYSKIFKREFVSIPNGIDTNYWSFIDLSQFELRKKLSIPLQKHVFLSTGLLIERKNPELLIKTFNEIDNDNYFLVVLGDGDKMQICQKLAQGNKNILFKGRVNNVKEYLFASNTLISISSSEGLPYSILEAKSTGIQMILSNIPQHVEVMGDEREGIEFISIDSRELFTSIMKCGKNLKRYKFDLSENSAQAMSSKYEKLYYSVYNIKLENNL